MFKKVKTFFILFIVSLTSASAMSYDEDVLNMFAKLSPRIALMSSVKEQLDKTLVITVLYEISDKQTASALQEKIYNNYKNGLSGYTLEVKKVSYANMQESAKSHVLFLLATDAVQLQSAVAFAKARKILTVAYDAKALENGVDISLYLGRKVMPYLNLQSIKEKNIELENILFRISKIYTSHAKDQQ